MRSLNVRPRYTALIPDMLKILSRLVRVDDQAVTFKARFGIK